MNMSTGAHCPQARIERWNLQDLVDNYLATLVDRKMVLVAFLMMRGLDKDAIMKALSIDEEDYTITKECLAFGLLFAGVKVRA